MQTRFLEVLPFVMLAVVYSGCPDDDKTSATDGGAEGGAPDVGGAAATAGGEGMASAPPTTPSSLIAKAISSSQVELAWAASASSPGVVGYKVYRDGAYLTSSALTMAVDTQVSANTKYCYTVYAYDAANNQSPSTTQQCATTLSVSATRPVLPLGISVTKVTATTATLSWTDRSDNEDGFQIGTCAGLIAVGGDGQRECGASFTRIAEVGANVTSYTATGLSPLTQYTYFVRAFNTAGVSFNQGVTFRTSAAPVAGRYLRVINDLYDQTVGTSLWGTWNTIISVRIAASSAEAIQTRQGERLATCEVSCAPSDLVSILPKYQQTTSYVDFDVSSLPPNYYVFIQTGWWDIQLLVFGTVTNLNLFEKHPTAVLCCNGRPGCYKWAAVPIVNHTTGKLEIKASQFLPEGSYYQSGVPYCP